MKFSNWKISLHVGGGGPKILTHADRGEGCSKKIWHLLIFLGGRGVQNGQKCADIINEWPLMQLVFAFWSNSQFEPFWSLKLSSFFLVVFISTMIFILWCLHFLSLFQFCGYIQFWSRLLGQPETARDTTRQLQKVWDSQGFTRDSPKSIKIDQDRPRCTNIDRENGLNLTQYCSKLIRQLKPHVLVVRTVVLF